ncbi:MAG: toll/interleukin-1 receptor domain-containing protein, partial [Phototrophicaceae bacterium]
MTHIFISYARVDGADYSLRLYNQLKAEGIAVWRDQHINPEVDFSAEIEEAIEQSSHVAVIITPDVKRRDSFVRLEIGYALILNKPIIPLVFAGGHRPIQIINHTYINFADWVTGYAQLLQRIKNPAVEQVDPTTQREFELAYLQEIGQRYARWGDLYT